MQLAGKTVSVRFRIGTDEGTGAGGWDIDKIAFTGITNTPFPSIVDNVTAACGDAGVPNPPDGGAPGLPDASTGGTGGGSGGGSTTDGSAPGTTGTTTGGVATGGAGGATGDGGNGKAGDGVGDGGCSCSTIGGISNRHLPGVLGLLGALIFVRRRRPRTAEGQRTPIEIPATQAAVRRFSLKIRG
jgi:hypothetical protein